VKLGAMALCAEKIVLNGAIVHEGMEECKDHVDLQKHSGEDECPAQADDSKRAPDAPALVHPSEPNRAVARQKPKILLLDEVVVLLIFSFRETLSLAQVHGLSAPRPVKPDALSGG